MVGNTQKKIPRSRTGRLNKKWSNEEITRILNYIQTVPQIESPTAQVYYKKLIQETGIDTSWNLLRWKIRYLKATLKRANDWLKSPSAELLGTNEGSDSVERQILRMCPHYEQLSEIFDNIVDNNSGQEYNEVMKADDDPLTVDESISIKSEFMSEDELSGLDAPDQIEYPEQKLTTATESQHKPTTIDKNIKEATEKMKKCIPKSSVAYLAAFQAERTAMTKLKYELEKEKHEKELIINEKKLKLMEEKQKADIRFKERELELKAFEIEKNEKIRILEIEKDERVRKYEIDMKYKYNNAYS